MIRVKVTVYKNVLVIDAVKPKHDKNFVPAGGSRIGCVLMDTAKHLGISAEAKEWISKNVKNCHDDIGDIDSWQLADANKGYCFSWLGGIKSIKSVGIEGSRTFNIHALPHKTIPNVSAAEAMAAIDKGE